MKKKIDYSVHHFLSVAAYYPGQHEIGWSKIQYLAEQKILGKKFSDDFYLIYTCSPALRAGFYGQNKCHSERICYTSQHLPVKAS